MADISEAAVRLVLDERGFDAALNTSVRRAAKQSGDTLDREMAAAGDKAGRDAGRAFGDGFSRDSNGRLRDARGRFVQDGDRMGRDAGDAAGSGFGDAMQKALAFRLSGGLLTALAAPLKGLAFAPLAAGAASAAASMVQFTAALAPAVGIVAGLPAAVGAGAAAMATLRVAMIGVGDAFGTALTGSAEEFDEALQKLAPSAQDAARALRSMAPDLQAVQQSVQGAAFTGVADAMRELGDALLGPVSSGMTAVATQGNQLALSLAGIAASSSGIGFVDSSFTLMAQLLDELSPAVSSLFDSLLQLGSQGADLFNGMTGGIVETANAFATWLSAAVESGDALGWITNAIDVFRQLGAILFPIITIITEIGRAASATGGDILGTVGTLVQAISGFLSSADGQTFLLNLFNGLNAVGQALTPVIAALGQALAPLLPIVAQIAVALGPGLQALITGLGQGLAALGPALVPLAQALSSIVAAASPLLPVVGQIAAVIANVLTGALTALMPIINVLTTALGQIFTPLMPVIESLMPAVTALGAALGAILEPLVPVVVQIVQVLSGALAPVLTLIANLFTQLGPAIGQIVTIVASVFMPMFEQLGTIIAALVPPISDLVLALLDALLPVIMALLPVFLQLETLFSGVLLDALVALLPAIVAIIEVVVQLVQILTPLITLIAQLVGWLAGLLVTAIQTVVGWITTLIGWLAQAVAAILDVGTWVTALGGWFADVGSAIADFVSGAYDRMVAFRDGVIDVFQTVVGWIGDLVQAFFDLPGKIVSGLSGIADSILNIFRPAINGVIGFLNDLIAGLNAVNPFDDIPLIPLLANGAILNRRTLFVGGEAGPEVVIPLTRPVRARQLAAASGLTRILAGDDTATTSTGTPTTTVVNVGPVVSNSPDPIIVAERVAARTAETLRGLPA